MVRIGLIFDDRRPIGTGPAQDDRAGNSPTVCCMRCASGWPAFRPNERPRRYALLLRPLSRQRGELTADGSPVRHVIAERFGIEMKELFGRPESRVHP